MTEIKELLDLGKTIAAGLFEGRTYPWEALDEIKDFIYSLGAELSPEEFDHPEEGVWIAKDAKFFLPPISVLPASSTTALRCGTALL